MQMDINGHGGQPLVVVTRQQQHARLQHKLQLQAERAEAMSSTPMTEEKRKENFFASLGLVTKSALSEIQNKKTERKRRTTANPQFSNAAIEAKRISAMETAARKQKRREAALAAAEEMRLPRATKQVRAHLPVFRRDSKDLDNNHSKLHKSLQQQTLQQSGKVSSNSSAILVPSRKSEKLLNSMTIASQASASSRFTSSSSGGLSGHKVSSNCIACSEHCDPKLDVVMFCKDCRCLFHATCAALVEEIIESRTVPCPGCDSTRSIEDEVSPGDSLFLESNNSSVKQKKRPRLDFDDHSKSHHSNSGRSDTVTLNRGENGASKKVDTKTHFRAKLKEQEQLVFAKISAEKNYTESRQKLAAVKENLKSRLEQQKQLMANRDRINRSFDVLTSYIKYMMKGDTDVEMSSEAKVLDTEAVPDEGTRGSSSQCPAEAPGDSINVLVTAMDVEKSPPLLQNITTAVKSGDDVITEALPSPADEKVPTSPVTPQLPVEVTEVLAVEEDAPTQTTTAAETVAEAMDTSSSDSPVLQLQTFDEINCKATFVAVSSTAQ